MKIRKLFGIRGLAKIAFASAVALCSLNASANIDVKSIIDNGEIHGSLTYGTADLYRGIDYNNRGPLMFGNLYYQNSKTFPMTVKLGMMAFNHALTPSSLGIGYYASFEGMFGKYFWNVMPVFYQYPEFVSPYRYNYFELKTYFGRQFDLFKLTAGLAYSPDWFDETGDAIFPSLRVDVPLPKYLVLFGEVGYEAMQYNSHWLGGNQDYWTWEVGANSVPFYHGLIATLSVVDTSIPREKCFTAFGVPGGATACDRRIVFKLTKIF